MRAGWLLLAVLPVAGGCVAKAAWDVATLPVKAAGKGVDVLTTSPKERDEKYAHEMRKRDEREAKERKQHDEACRKDADKCGPYSGFRARKYED